jgi:broad specificity phosphatase PhoE
MNQYISRAGLFLLLWALQSISQPAAQALDLYFIRHAQTMANVTREYTPENQRTFSPLGEEQVDGVAAKLAGYTFDRILVSPAHRAIHTILPYLEANQRVADIWPELYECCWDYHTKEDEPTLTRGPRIEFTPDTAPYFRFRDEDAVYMLDVDTPARGRLMVAKAIELIESQLGASNETVLIVSHYHTSSRIMRALLGEDVAIRIQPQNARLSHLHRDTNGQWHLLMLNDEAKQ